jgi:hypothetical protein
LILITKKPGFVNDAIYDYRLKVNSPVINVGFHTGKVNGTSLLPAWHYVHIARKQKRVISEKID